MCSIIRTMGVPPPYLLCMYGNRESMDVSEIVMGTSILKHDKISFLKWTHNIQNKRSLKITYILSLYYHCNTSQSRTLCFEASYSPMIIHSFLRTVPPCVYFKWPPSRVRKVSYTPVKDRQGVSRGCGAFRQLHSQFW